MDSANKLSYQPVEPALKFMLAADIDGTLISGNAEVNNIPFQEFIRQYYACLYLVLVSGRSLLSINELIDNQRLPKPHFIGSAVGTELFDCNDNNNSIGKKFAEQAPQKWDSEQIYALGEGTGIQRQKFNGKQPRFQAGFNWDGQASTYTAFCERLAAVKNCQILPSSSRFIDVMPDNMGKENIARFLQKELNVPAARIVVAGDSGNDRGLFTAGFKGILPSNAREELKAVACKPWHYQSDFPVSKGVMDGLYYWGFIE